MSSKLKYFKVGDIRPSQLLYSYGIGALADLPGMSVIILGIDSWQKSKCRLIHEERLLQSVKAALGDQVMELRLAPSVEEDIGPQGQDMSFKRGVPVKVFPAWMRCSACNRLLHTGSSEVKLLADTFRPEQSYFFHVNCQVGRNKAQCKTLPVRFMVACRNGHLSEFPWVDFVHKGTPCSEPLLRISDDSTTGDATQISVTCLTCRKSRRLVEAIGDRGKQNLPPCGGEHPHLPAHTGDECEEDLRTIALGASNLWFPVVISALSIPEAMAGLAELVHQRWDMLSTAESVNDIKLLKKLLDKQAKLGDLGDYADEDIWQCIVSLKDSAGSLESDPYDIKGPEYGVLAGGNEISTTEFRLRYVPPPAGYEKLIERVGLVERLREVKALTAFTRIESAGDSMAGADDTKSKRAPISAVATDWVPVSEVRGEGIFLQFREERVEAWCQLPAVKVREDQLREAHIHWRKVRQIDNPEAGFPGIRYVLLHSFAHALMRQLALDCGYTAASIRERIYAEGEETAIVPMAGVLLYTAAPDSEGTLGGLVSLGDPQALAMHIDQALESISTCAADPLCSEHDPLTDASLHGAACHSCLFASETSCEKGNHYLDRATILSVIDEPCTPFFGRSQIRHGAGG